MSHLPVKVRDQSDLVSPIGYVSQRSKVRSLVNLNSSNFHQYLSKMSYNLIYRFMSLFCLFYCFYESLLLKSFLCYLCTPLSFLQLLFKYSYYFFITGIPVFISCIFVLLKLLFLDR